MKNSINTTVEEFSRKYFSPSQDEQLEISTRYNQLMKLLPGSEIFQSGSYPRHTAVTPVHDLDVIWVMPESWQLRITKAFAVAFNKQDFSYDISQPLEELANYLRMKYQKIGVKVEIDDNQRHAVKISFPDTDNSKEPFTIDVVPAVKSGRNHAGNDIYLVPEIQKAPRNKREKILKDSGDRVKWILSDPKFYLDQAQRIYYANDSYRKAVRFIKTWRRACNSGLANFELQSFHLEQVLAQIFLEDNTLDTIRAVKLLFVNFEYWLTMPRIPDAANSDVFIDSYLEKDIDGIQRKMAVNYATRSLAILISLNEDATFSDVHEAIRLVLIAPSPWTLIQGFESNLDIICHKERIKKITNPKHYSRKYTSLPKEIIADINGPNQLSSGESVKPGYRLTFTPILTNISYDQIKWLIVNTGSDALEKKRIVGWRGFEFNDCNIHLTSRIEKTEYIGDHWVECYVIRDGKCIGTGRFEVCISN